MFQEFGILGQELFQDLWKNQFCVKNIKNESLNEKFISPSLVFFEKVGTGIGSRFNVIAQGFGEALMTRHIAGYLKHDWFFITKNSEDCEEGTLNCYLRPSFLQPHMINSTKTHLTTPAEQECKKIRCSRRMKRNECCSYGYDTIEHAHYAPSKYSNFTKFQWNSLLHFWAFQPNDKVMQEVEFYRQKFGWNNTEERIIGVHVRHGGQELFFFLLFQNLTKQFLDKSIESRTFPFSSYIKAIETYANQYNTFNLFISTEDDQVLVAAQSYFSQKKQPWRIYFTEHNRTNIRVQQVSKGAVQLDVHKEMIHSLANLVLMMDVDFFVGTYSSNWSRLVLKMMYATYGYLPPFTSLDEWAHDAVLQKNPELDSFMLSKQAKFYDTN